MTVLILFVFNRPDVTKEVLSAIAAQTSRPDKMIVFADGPRDETERAKTDAVRALIRNIHWMDISLVERRCNLGCTANILQGITEVLQTCSRAVILEDDILPAPRFFESMAVLLNHYQNERVVFSVGGYPSVRADALPGYPFDVIVSPRFSCWGWGTWADRWWSMLPSVRGDKHPAPSAAGLPRQAGTDLQHGSATTRAEGEVSWDTRIALRCLQCGLLHVLTRSYLVRNIAIGSGTHGGKAALTKTMEFMQQHNIVVDHVPQRFAPVERRDDVGIAVQEYISDILQAYATDSQVGVSKSDGVLAHIRKWSHNIRRKLVSFTRLWIGPQPPAGEPQPVPEAYTALLGKGSVVPVQIEAYFLALNAYVEERGSVLDVGFGLGYGLNILAIKAQDVSGVDVDSRAYEHCQATVRGRNPRLRLLRVYDGSHLPFPDAAFDVVTCVDVLEHVANYDLFITEMLRVSRQGVFVSTPNRRPEHTNPDGTPQNRWHRREWSYEELAEILRKHPVSVEWNFINGPLAGPFTITQVVVMSTQALSPFLRKTAL